MTDSIYYKPSAIILHAQDHDLQVIIISPRFRFNFNINYLVIPLGDRFDDDDTLVVKLVSTCTNP